MWIFYALLITGAIKVDILPESFQRLTKPNSIADFGQAFSAFDGLISSITLIIGLIAIISQSTQSTQANRISAYTARLQFLIADSERIELLIQSLKLQSNYNQALFSNLAKKKARQLEEAQKLDIELKKLLEAY